MNGGGREPRKETERNDQTCRMTTKGSDGSLKPTCEIYFQEESITGIKFCLTDQARWGLQVSIGLGDLVANGDLITTDRGAWKSD